jgi:hypothetical protein
LTGPGVGAFFFAPLTFRDTPDYKALMKLFSSIGRWWRRSQRVTDVEVLWPACKSVSDTPGEAQSLFLMCCLTDPCWRNDFDDDEIEEIVGGLK